MKVRRRRRASLVFAALLALLASITLFYFGYRAQAKLAALVQRQAEQQGVLVDAGQAEVGVFSVGFPHVKLRFRDAPGISAALREVRLRGALFGTPEVTIEEARFSVAGEPTTIYEGLLAFPDWKGVPVSWQRLDVDYSQRILGKVAFEEVRLERTESAFAVHAAEVRLAAAAFRRVRLSIAKRNQLIEIGLGEPEGQISTTQVGYFGATRGVSQWMLSARHQPVRPLAQQLGWELGPAFDEARAVVSSTLIVPEDRARPTRGNLELALDHFPKPAWPDAAALLGDTAAFVAHLERPEQGSRWDLQRATVSLSLFTMTGVAHVRWGALPTVSLEVAGKLTCAQLRGNLPPSVYLDQVQKYLESEAAAARNGELVRDSVPSRPARAKEEVELRLRLGLESAAQGKRQAAWHLGPGCGLPELDSGEAPTPSGVP